MEFKEVEAFLAVAEELHFGRAAEKLHMSQPPLSMRVKQLEKELGIQLFDRSTRNVRLTSAGQQLVAPAGHALRTMRKFSDVAKSLVSGEAGVVSIGFAGASSYRSLPRLTRAVRQAFPEIDLQLHSQTYVYTAMEMLQEGTLDLAFSRLPTSNDELDSRIIEIERLICALPEDHHLAALDEIDISLLADEEFVSLPSTQGSILQSTMLSLCVAAGFNPNITQEAPDSATVLALVAAGAGVTITLSSTQGAQSQGIAYKPLMGIRPKHMFATLAWRKDNSSAALRSVLEVSEAAIPTPDLSNIENNPFLNSIGL
ncbi:LysR family transcriptional regulator [Glutamicibacter sp. NPDC127525]|uniref:LysR family transcriptional regulator n=1 Tax=unclassified Glutamicibacter TaxID=2627139 RepID=UPI00362EB840